MKRSQGAPFILFLTLIGGKQTTTKKKMVLRRHRNLKLDQDQTYRLGHYSYFKHQKRVNKNKFTNNLTKK